MTWQIELIVLAGTLAVLLLSGVWTAFALLGAGALLIVLQGRGLGLQGLGIVAYNSNNSFLLSAIPMFVLLGQIIFASGLSARFFSGLSFVFSRVPGGLLPGSILACGVFAATTGTSVATAAAVGSVALPEMKDRGYDATFAAGAIAAGGSLGILTPPSVALIVYSSLENVSITKLFAAGLLPAVVMALAFIGYITIRVGLSSGGYIPVQPRRDERVRFGLIKAVANTLPVIVLIGGILGSIYGGIATPTEAAAVGVIGSLAVSVGNLSWAGLFQAGRRTIEITAMVFSILLGGQVLSYAVTNGGIAQAFDHWVVTHDVGTITLLFFMCALFILLGDFVEGLGMMIITIPFLYPIFVAHGFNPILLGVVVAILIELGQITPPVGLNLFVLRGIDPSIRQLPLVKATLPYVGIMICVIVLLVSVPSIALWLPGRLAI